MHENGLIEELPLAGFGGALPLRDRRIGLIAYADLAVRVEFRGISIKMRASSEAAFGLQSK